MPDEESGRGSGRPSTAFTSSSLVVLAHGLLLFGFEAVLLYVVPRFLDEWIVIRIKLPAVTKALVALSHYMDHFVFASVPVFLLALAGDGRVFYLLRTKARSRVPGRLWALAGFAVLALLWLWAVIALCLPSIAIRSGSTI